MTISSAALLPILDSLGVMGTNLAALSSTTEGTAIATGASNNATRILALTDLGQVSDLAGGFNSLLDASTAPNKDPKDIFTKVFAAINKHVGKLDTFLTTNTAQVPKAFADIWRAVYSDGSLVPANVFQDTAVVARTATITGATTVTQSAGTDLDKTLVAPVQYQLHITTDIGSATTVTLTMKKTDATTVTKTVSLTTADVANGNVDVGTSSDKYVGCTNVAVTGGTSGAFQVRNKIVRTASL